MEEHWREMTSSRQKPERKARKREQREKRDEKKTVSNLRGGGEKSRPEAVRGQRGPFLSAV